MKDWRKVKKFSGRVTQYSVVVARITCVSYRMGQSYQSLRNERLMVSQSPKVMAQLKMESVFEDTLT